MEATLTLKANDQLSGPLKRIGGNLKSLGAPLKSLAGGFNGIKNAFKGTSDQAGQTGSRLKALGGGLLQLTKGAAGLTLGLARLPLSTARAGAALTRWLGRQTLGRLASGLKDLSGRAVELGKSLNDLAAKAGASFAKLTALGAAFGYGFKRLFVDLASSVEEQGLRLTNALGGKALGAEALKNVRAFSVATGRDLADATAAFAALAEGGIKPTEAHLKNLADMAAKKNKSLAETGEAFKRALKGDSSALEEWGVKSEAVGKHILYKYKDQAGKMVSLAARADRPEAIAKLLAKVSQDKAAGADQDRARTFQGTLARLTAKWLEFRAMTMDSGPFQFLKYELAGILDWVNRLDLPKLSKDLGGRLTEALKSVKDGLKSAWEWLSKWGPEGLRFVRNIGGAKTMLAGLAAALSGPVVAALGVALKSVAAFAKALTLTPVGLLVLAGAGLVALMQKAGALEPFIEGLKEGFKGFSEAIGPALTGLLEALGQAFEPIGNALKKTNDNLGPEGWRELGRAIAELTTGVLKTLLEMLTKAVELMGKLKGAGEVLGDKLADVTGPNIQRGDDMLQRINSVQDPAERQRLLKEAGFYRQQPAAAPSSSSPKPAPSDINNPEAITGPLTGSLADISQKLNQPTPLNLSVTIKGSVDGAAVSASVTTNTPGAKISDSQAQSMGMGGATS